MGVKITGLLNPRKISVKELQSKTIAFDTFNMLYQFLATIRSADGTLLKTSTGKTTSHLVGLFSRTSYFRENGIRPIYVFDGKAPELKQKERDRRKSIKIAAQESYEKAAEEADFEQMKKYASMTSKLDDSMIDDTKKMLGFMGVSYVEAPGEGEACAAALVRAGKAYASASQDYDSLLFKSPRLVRELSASGKKRKSGKIGFYTVEPEMIVLNDMLNELHIDHDQLIVLGILIGTDYNIGGIKGIGPKKALKLIERHGHDFDALFKEVRFDEYFESGWKEIFNIFRDEPIDNIKIIENDPDNDSLKELLVKEYEFSEDRIDRYFEKLKLAKDKDQKSLSSFFGG
jgi:flap endonuclease-1